MFIALAPVASTEGLKAEKMIKLSHFVEPMVFLLTDVLSFYNWFHLSDLAIKVLNNLFGFHIFQIGEKGNGNGNFPAGQSYRCSVYYSQSIRGHYKFSLYDYGVIENLKVYKQKHPPTVPLANFQVPTVMMSGDADKLADPEDVAWLTEQLGANVVFA